MTARRGWMGAQLALLIAPLLLGLSGLAQPSGLAPVLDGLSVEASLAQGPHDSDPVGSSKSAAGDRGARAMVDAITVPMHGTTSIRRSHASGGESVSDAEAPDRGRRLATGEVSAFDRAGVQYTEHFATRIAQREARGISGQNALDAYNRGSRFYDPATGAHLRYDRQTGIAVVLRKGRAHTVFEQPRPSSRWNPVRYGSN